MDFSDNPSRDETFSPSAALVRSSQLDAIDFIVFVNECQLLRSLWLSIRFDVCLARSQSKHSIVALL